MKELFKNKNYLLLFQGSLISAIGNSLYGFAAGLYVQDMYRFTDPDLGALYLTLFMFISITVNVICSPFAGVLVDKWNKIKVLYITDWIRGFLFIGTFILLNQGFGNQIVIYILLASTFISSLNQAFFQPASGSVIPEVVGEDMIQQANGANSIIQSIQNIVGITAGIFLYGILGFKLIVLVNAISFVVSAISEMFIKTPFEKQSKLLTFNEFKKDFVTGIKFIVSKEGFLTMMIFSLVLNFAFTPLFALGIPYLFRTELGATVFQIGVVEVIFSIAMMIGGVIVGSMVIKDLNKTVKHGILSLILSFILTSVIIGLVTYEVIDYPLFYGLFIVANIALAITMMYTNVPLNTAMMKAIDKDIRGRVFGAMGALSQGAIPFAILIGGYIMRTYNTAILGLFCSVLVLIVGIVYVFNKGVYNMLNGLNTPVEENSMVTE